MPKIHEDEHVIVHYRSGENEGYAGMLASGYPESDTGETDTRRTLWTISIKRVSEEDYRENEWLLPDDLPEKILNQLIDNGVRL